MGSRYFARSNVLAQTIPIKNGHTLWAANNPRVDQLRLPFGSYQLSRSVTFQFHDVLKPTVPANFCSIRHGRTVRTIHSIRIRHAFSKETTKKLNLHTPVRVRIYHDGDDAQAPARKGTTKAALEILDRLCRLSDHRGFECLTTAVQDLSRLPEAQCTFQLSSLRQRYGDQRSTSGKSTAGLSGSWRWTLLMDQTKARMRLTMRPEKCVNLKLVDSRGTSAATVDTMVSLEAELLDIAPDVNTNGNIDDNGEIDFLSESISMVEERLSQAMTFATTREAASSFAETLFRVLLFRTPRFRMRSLCLDLSYQQGVFLTQRHRAVAKWGHSTPSTPKKRDVQEEPIVEVTVTSTTDQHEAEEYDGEDESPDSHPRFDESGVSGEELSTESRPTRPAVTSTLPQPQEENRAVSSKQTHEPLAANSDADPETNDGDGLPRHGRAFIAIGSNVGDRLQEIELACRKIDEEGSLRIVDTSHLYETQPMYVTDQDSFLNGVCEVQTSLQPMELLDRLQAIENGLGRVKTIDKGPRNIDLDIVAYDNEVFQTERLTLPHALMLEREFVLRPLCDTAGANFIHPNTQHTSAHHLARLPLSAGGIYPFTPLAPHGDAIRPLKPGGQTLIMSILNVTPDSFSDGGVHSPTDVSSLRETISAHIAAGASIIDIGGQSSRPNAADITAEEEIARVLPAIEAVKSLPEAEKVAISVDTYRASVAEAAVQAGAHIINDVSAGLLDPDMLSTIAKLGCTYVMMHMRGTPATMQDPSNTSYPKGPILTIASELRARLRAARKAGIRRWRIILDPGIGFAKTIEQNLEILRSFRALRYMGDLRGYPWLVGTSRKAFVGKITGVPEANERQMGTAATVTAAIQVGADIVRVHDVKEMAEVAKMADALYRRGFEEQKDGA